MAKTNTPEFTKPHPLLVNYWVGPDDAEHSTVLTRSIADITRATDAIRTLSRIVHNSISEPAMTRAQPFDDGTMRSLLCGIEVLGQFIFEQTELMRERAADVAKWEREQGDKNAE
ncbi:hypothetical protein L0Z26_16255 [Burkholderia multivorans]|uniref:hypothetical protein n=1 Tax=Burkholderia multivorans TaxID=87883 RepID=UPI002019128B|nr:hypothetical protein [Burkholderia multivorans]MCO1343435.1 hypothetical protein [Burkholderia multivorans]MCO1443898.1 hypothetical protein [Burkholderia multivorans]UQO29329.1 hypothetical protein L0Z21_04640 [Burkholderia multivorans]